MNTPDLRELTIVTIRDPGAAARVLLAWPLTRETLWTLLVLIAVLNAVLFSLSNLLVPGPSPLPGVLNHPLIYCAVVAGGLALSVYALLWAGRFLGGSGSLAGVMQVVLWLQVLRLLVQAVTLILVLTIPLLSVLLFFAASIYGIYILLHFIRQAHGLPSMGRAAAVVIVAMVAILLGLTLLMSLFGGPIMGSLAYV